MRAGGMKPVRTTLCILLLTNTITSISLGSTSTSPEATFPKSLRMSPLDGIGSFSGDNEIESNEVNLSRASHPSSLSLSLPSTETGNETPVDNYEFRQGKVPGEQDETSSRWLSAWTHLSFLNVSLATGGLGQAEENLTSFLPNSNMTTSGISLEESGVETLKELGWGDIGLIMLYCSIIAGTLIGNTLVIAAVATTRRLRTVTNCFVMSLAVADWLVGMFVMPLKVVFHLSHNVWNFGSLVCKIWIALDVLLCTSSILSLCTISIDRYLAITRPLAYSRRRRSKRLALAMISCVWVGSVAITSPPMFGWLSSEKSNDECDYEDDAVYVVYSALGSFFVPLLVMLYVYARIACVIARRQKTIQKAHKSKDKDKVDMGEEIGLTMHRVATDGSIKSAQTQKRMAATQRRPPGPPFTFFRREGGRKVASVPEADSIWTRLHCLRNSKKSKEDQNHRNRIPTLGEEAPGTLPSEIPSPSTLLSMGAGGGPTNPTQTVHRIYCRNQSGCSGSGRKQHLPSSSPIGNPVGLRMTTTRTGSRLCNHNLTNSSPPISIIHRVQPSSSSGTQVGGLLREPGNVENNSTVWTIEDSDHEGGGRENGENSRLTRSTLNLDGCRNCLEEQLNAEGYLGTNSVDDLTRSLQHPEDAGKGGGMEMLDSGGSRINYASSRQSAGLRRHPGKTQSQSCGHLQLQAGNSSNKVWNSNQNQNHVARSKSVKVTVSHQLSDQAQAQSGPSRDFSTGRVASFKRETKTAQTLAAVVGGFIICWLPFFVAYVIGPFIKPDAVPAALMEFFTWLETDGWESMSPAAGLEIYVQQPGGSNRVPEAAARLETGAPTELDSRQQECSTWSLISPPDLIGIEFYDVLELEPAEPAPEAQTRPSLILPTPGIPTRPSIIVHTADYANAAESSARIPGQPIKNKRARKQKSSTQKYPVSASEMEKSYRNARERNVAATRAWGERKREAANQARLRLVFLEAEHKALVEQFQLETSRNKMLKEYLARAEQLFDNKFN